MFSQRAARVICFWIDHRPGRPPRLGAENPGMLVGADAGMPVIPPIGVIVACPNAPGRTRTSDLRFRRLRRFPDGPDHLIILTQPKQAVGGCRGLPAGVDTRAVRGLLPGRLTRWSLHLPTAAGSMENSAPRRRLGSGLPVPDWGCGFPRIHPVRHGTFPARAPLSEGNRRSILLSYERSFQSGVVPGSRFRVYRRSGVAPR